MVELIVVMVIMAILLTLGIINVNNTRVNQRDAERRADAENIARGLERYYNEVNINPATNASMYGVYPDIAVGQNHIVSASVLPGVDPASYRFSFNSNNINFKVATAGAAVENSAIYSAQTDINSIYYEPLVASGTGWAICESGQTCVRFNLYYRTERDNTVQIIRSNRQ